MTSPTGLPHVPDPYPHVDPDDVPVIVTRVIHVTGTAPDHRVVVAAFAHPILADWFTDQLRPGPGEHYETAGFGIGPHPGSYAGIALGDVTTALAGGDPIPRTGQT